MDNYEIKLKKNGKRKKIKLKKKQTKNGITHHTVLILICCWVNISIMIFYFKF